MQYVSTRGGMAPAGFTEVILSGLAPDGGLAVPVELPALDAERLEAWRSLGYAQLAVEVVGLFATDIPEDDLSRLIDAAYGIDRFPAPVVPVRRLDAVAEGLGLVGLSEGPTLAFKDLAMQFLGESMTYALHRRGRVLNILGATSGDTGSAAEHAFRGKPGIAMFMLSPLGRMSDVQRAQMYSLQDPNIHNIAVDGVFDDCQNLVKALNNDAEFKRTYSIGAVNSINIGRIVAQVVYYVWTWLRASDDVDAAARSTFRIDVAVPSGNFGNVYAGHVARSMGVPIRRLIVATNENNVLDEFFRTGVYRPRTGAETLATSSPSMDISKASNLERFVWNLLGPEAFAERWEELERTGVLDLSDQLERLHEDFGFASATSTHADRLRTIALVHSRGEGLVDPHTADGISVALQLMEPGFPTYVMETAKADKFNETVTEALGVEQPRSERITSLLGLPQRTVTIDDDEQPLREIIVRHAVRSAYEEAAAAGEAGTAGTAPGVSRETPQA